MRTRRAMIKIDEDLCNGCGDCITSCAEGALEIVDGKAKLVSENFCDGLGACLGECPTGALTIEERDADDFDEEAVAVHLAAQKQESAPACPGSASPVGGCPGSRLQEILAGPAAKESVEVTPSRLSHWPIQLTLVPPTAPFLRDADLLLCADCVPFAMFDFHQRYLASGRPILIACPKLDNIEPYIEKMGVILESAGLKSLTIVRMEVPCCGGLRHIVRTAMANTGATVPVQEHIIGISGEHLEVLD